MSKSLRPPTVANQVGSTKTRVHDLERRLAKKPLTPADIPGYIAKFSLAGPLVASRSGSEVHPHGGRLILLYAVINTPGESTTTLDFLKNQTVFSTMNLLLGVGYNEIVVNMPFSARKDELQVEITVAGTGSDTLSVFGQFDK